MGKLDENQIQIKEIATPAGNPPAGYRYQYMKADGLLYTKDSAGVERLIGDSSSTTAIVAFATGGQGGATALLTDHNKVDTVATLADSVLMPAALVGRSCVVNIDSGAAFAADVFPTVGDNFEGLAVNIATPVAAGAFIECFCYVDGEWNFE